MRYKLISIDDALSTATTVNLPYIELKISDRAGTITNGATIGINLGASVQHINFVPVTNYVVNGNVTLAGLDKVSDGFGYTFLVNKESTSIINDSKGIFADTSEISSTESSKVTATTQQFSGDGDFTAVTRVGSSLSFRIHGAGKVQVGTTLPFLLPVSIIGNQSGTIFNVILSFDIPSNLRSSMGTGQELPSGETI